jgi:hypothetical protein
MVSVTRCKDKEVGLENSSFEACLGENCSDHKKEAAGKFQKPIYINPGFE